MEGRGIAPEIIIRGETPLPPSLRSALPGMPLASRADAPPEGKVKWVRGSTINQCFPKEALIK